MPIGSVSTQHPLLSPRDSVRLLSLVIPVYNEEGVIPKLRSAVTGFAEVLRCPLEIVLVNDGSSDGSLAGLCEWARVDERVRVVALARNFGHQAAATAGLDVARGDAVVLIDADLQDPLEVIHPMIAKYLEGYDVVYGQRRSRAGESQFKRGTAWAFYRLLRMLGSPNLPPDTGDFRLISRRCLDALKSLREQHRFLRGLCSWVGFAQVGVVYDRHARVAGFTKYSLRKMLRFAFDAIASFSEVPLRLSLYAGAMLLVLGLLLGLCAIACYVVGSHHESFWIPLGCLTSLATGLILLSNGVLGEYVGRVFAQVKGRPLYVIAKLFPADVAASESRPSEPNEAHR